MGEGEGGRVTHTPFSICFDFIRGTQQVFFFKLAERESLKKKMMCHVRKPRNFFSVLTTTPNQQRNLNKFNKLSSNAEIFVYKQRPSIQIRLSFHFAYYCCRLDRVDMCGSFFWSGGQEREEGASGGQRSKKKQENLVKRSDKNLPALPIFFFFFLAGKKITIFIGQMHAWNTKEGYRVSQKRCKQI